MEEFKRKKAMSMLVAGIVLILNQMYLKWDIWVVIGALAIIKGLMIWMMPCCEAKKKR
jgi:hypothetical protein